MAPTGCRALVTAFMLSTTLPFQTPILRQGRLRGHERCSGGGAEGSTAAVAGGLRWAGATSVLRAPVDLRCFGMGVTTPLSRAPASNLSQKVLADFLDDTFACAGTRRRGGRVAACGARAAAAGNTGDWLSQCLLCPGCGQAIGSLSQRPGRKRLR